MAESIKLGIKGTSVKRLIVAALVIATVIAFAVSIGRESGPVFSVRVVRYTPGDTNALVEITNNIGSRLNCYSWVHGGTRLAQELGPYGMALISLPAKDKYGKAAQVAFIGSRIPSGPWMARWASALARIGIDLHAPRLLQFSVTNTKEWMHSREFPQDSR